MKMSNLITIEIAHDGVAVMTLNRAPVNAVNPEFLDLIAKQLSDLEANTLVRALIFTSAFKVFSAGMDLKEAINFSTQDQTNIVDGLNVTFAKLYGFSKPVIAAVNGSAIAGGLFFVLAADYSIAADSAELGLAEIRAGVNFPIGPLEIARSALTPGCFRRVLLTGQPIIAQDAKKLQMIDEVHSVHEVLPKAMSVAGEYALLPQKTFASIKSAASETTINTCLPGLTV
jgi:enoyl-CoA hydratase